MATTTVLPAEIFDVQVNIPLIHQVVGAQLAAARQGTHATKTRAMVSGGGKKPARQGSTRAPQFAGGGVVHGPQPRDYSQRTPKKMKAAALRGALSDRARHGRVHVIDALVSGDAPSTAAAAKALAGVTTLPKLLVVIERGDVAGFKSVRNLGNVHVLMADQLNTYDVLCSDEVVFTRAALEAFAGRAGVDLAEAAPAKADKAPKAEKAEKAEKPAKSLVEEADAAEAPKATKAAKAVEVQAPAAPAADAAEVRDFGPDSAAPLADGSAPEGFDIKGNADSMLYHEPDGRWFRTAEAAQAAGFTKAGSRASKEESK